VSVKRITPISFAGTALPDRIRRRYLVIFQVFFMILRRVTLNS